MSPQTLRSLTSSAPRRRGCKDAPPFEVDHLGGCLVCAADAGEACRRPTRDWLLGPPDPKRRASWAGRKAKREGRA